MGPAARPQSRCPETLTRSPFRWAICSVGTHTFTATYSGDSNYVPTPPGTPYSTTAPYLITVNAGSLVTTTTGLTGVPASTTYGTAFTATATVAGTSPTGSVEFVVNGVVYTTATLSSGMAQASFNLGVGTYNITVIYSGDAVNAGSTSVSAPLTVGPALTTTTLVAGTTTTTLGHPVTLTATVASLAGSPTGTVNFTYSATSGGTQVLAGSSTLNGGTATASSICLKGQTSLRRPMLPAAALRHHRLHRLLRSP